jgi:hypothetical protein
MSSFYLTVRHKKTGKQYIALALDDYFGKHEYGYSVIGVKDPLREVDFYSQYDVTKDNKSIIKYYSDLSKTMEQVEESRDPFHADMATQPDMVDAGDK